MVCALNFSLVSRHRFYSPGYGFVVSLSLPGLSIVRVSMFAALVLYFLLLLGFAVGLMQIIVWKDNTDLG